LLMARLAWDMSDQQRSLRYPQCLT